MGLKDLAKTIIGKGAPLLGSVLGGPAGGAIGGLVASAVGADSDDPDEILQKITNDPDAARKLKELELKHKERLEELKIEGAKIKLDELKIQTVDTADARARERAIVERTGKKDINLYILAWVVVGGFFMLTGFLIFWGEKLTNNETATAILYILFGGLVSGFATVLGYFFGSSKGSAEKTNLIVSQRQGRPAIPTIE